jgi:hypothetical protein
MPHDLAAGFFSRVEVGTPVEVIGNARNVTHVRKAIPLVQSRNFGRGVNASEMIGSARNMTQVKRALPVVQPEDSSRGTKVYSWTKAR